MAKKKSKAQRRSVISQIIGDGKITKKEGRRAAEAGISLRKLQNRNIGDYRQSVRDFDRRGRADMTPGSRRPTFEPLKIKRGAVDADRQRDSGRTRGGGRDNDRRRRRTGGGGGGGGGGGVDPTPTNTYQKEIDEILGGVVDPPKTADEINYAELIKNAQEEAARKQEEMQAAFEKMMLEREEELQRIYDEQVAAQAAEQERIRKEQEAAARQAELERNVAMKNTVRSGLGPQFQIGSIGQTSAEQYGTSGFKRRLKIAPQVNKSLNTLMSSINSRLPMSLNI